MKLRTLLLATLALIAPHLAWAACPSPLAVTTSTGTDTNFGVTTDGSGNCVSRMQVNLGGTDLVLGQGVMAASVPVAIASDQGAYTVNLGTIGAAATAALQTTGNTSLATIATNTTGSATAALQTTGNTSLATIATNTTGASTAALQTTGNTSLATIATNTTGVSTSALQTTGNTSLSTIATNTTGVSTSALQTTGNTSLATIATNTTGVATSALQTTGNTSLATIDTDIKATEPRTVFKTANAASSPSVCGSTATVTPSTATDTLVVEISGSTDIYVCDFSASSNGVNNFYLESAAAAGCTSTLAQLGNTWYATQYWAKSSPNAFYRGTHVGAGKGLCLHTTAAQNLSVTVYYDQY